MIEMKKHQTCVGTEEVSFFKVVTLGTHLTDEHRFYNQCGSYSGPQY